MQKGSILPGVIIMGFLFIVIGLLGLFISFYGSIYASNFGPSGGEVSAYVVSFGIIGLGVVCLFNARSRIPRVTDKAEQDSLSRSDVE